MTKHRRKAKVRAALAAVGVSELPETYRHACRLATEGQHDEARRFDSELHTTASDARPRALICNDLATLDAVNGKFDAARQGLEEMLAIDESCRPARLNLELLVNRLGLFQEPGCDAKACPARVEPCPSTNKERARAAETEANAAQTVPRPPAITERNGELNGGINLEAGSLKVVGGDCEEPTDGVVGIMNGSDTSHAEHATPIRVAILSFLFNWPSTGGGNIHTVELATFLGRGL